MRHLIMVLAITLWALLGYGYGKYHAGAICGEPQVKVQLGNTYTF